MLRSSAAISILLLTLTACPVDHVILSGDLESSTGEPGTAGMSSTDEPSDTVVGTTSGEPDPTTGAPLGCEDMTPAEICEAHPWAGGCSGLGSELECADMLEVIAATPACDAITPCEYAACADALADEECTARPPECAALLACLNAEMPPPPNCCEDHGEVEGAPGLCALTADHKCVGCDYEPVLCMTHGCGAVGDEDCCLSDDGETVPCDAPIVEVPGPIIVIACNPPAGLCENLEADCIGAGVDGDRCLELAQGVCPGSKCLACERMLAECEESSPGECDAIAKRCGAALDGCDCGAEACVDMVDAPLPTLFASCFAFPLALGCEELSTGQCFTTLTYSSCAGLTTCEYHDCMRAIDELAACTDETPAECAEVSACVAAEATAS